MRQTFRLFGPVLLVLSCSAAIVSAATTAQQLVDLSRAGLSDDILVALIQTDGSTFQLTAEDILSLHKQGLSDRVILVMAKTARQAAAVEPVPAFMPEPAPAPPAPVVNVYQHV